MDEVIYVSVYAMQHIQNHGTKRNLTLPMSNSSQAS